MAQCKWCGKKGMFLKVSAESGMCKECHPIIDQQVAEDHKIMQTSFDRVAEVGDTHEKIKLYETIKEYAQKLSVYSQKGIIKVTPCPDELIEICEKRIKELMASHQPHNKKISAVPICPYCNCLLPSSPKKKSRCKKCSNVIYVNNKQTIFPRSLLTEEEVEAWKWFCRLASFGVTQTDFLNESDELSQRFKTKAPPRDVVWSLFNKICIKLSQQNDLSSLANLFYYQALFLYQEDKNYFAALELYHDYRLKSLLLGESDIIKKVEIGGNSDSCKFCKPLHGKRLSFEEAINKKLLPNKSCVRPLKTGLKPFCRCSYNPVTVTYRELGLDIDEL